MHVSTSETRPVAEHQSSVRDGGKNPWGDPRDPSASALTSQNLDDSQSLKAPQHGAMGKPPKFNFRLEP